MNFTATEKRNIKNAIIARLQHHRRCAHYCGVRGELDRENFHYKSVREIEAELYVNGFHVRSFVGGLNQVMGISLEVRAERTARWNDIVRVFKFLTKFEK